MKNFPLFSASLTTLFLFFFVLTVYSLSFQLFHEVNLSRQSSPKTILAAAPARVLGTSTATTSPIALIPPPILPASKDTNFLLLGLDARIGDSHPRCDAIHMITVQPAARKIIVATVPRGTKVIIPGVEENSSYISNLCGYKGVDAAIPTIEKIVGVKADHIVKVGFSQAIGLFRLAGLPGSDTLAFLRDRKSYGIGDYQRSSNQALFLKDTVINNLDRINSIPEPFQKLAFQMVDTDLTFDQAKQIFQTILQTGILQNPDSIVFVVKPEDGRPRQAIHYTAPSLNTDSQFEAYQKDLIVRLQQLLQTTKTFPAINTPFSQKVWLQIEDQKTRDEIHYGFLQTFVATSPDSEKARLAVEEFILEMQQSANSPLTQQAQTLLQ